MNNKFLIAFCGNSGAGKDTAAKFFIDKFNFKQAALASPIKEFVLKIFDLDYDQVYGSKKEKTDDRYGLSPRKMLQTVGDVFRNDLYMDIWINYLIRMLETPLFKNKSVVVSDLRYFNELVEIQKIGGIVIKLERETLKGKETVGYAQHRSEIELQTIADKEFDYILKVPEGKEAFEVELEYLAEDLGIFKENEQDWIITRNSPKEKGLLDEAENYPVETFKVSKKDLSKRVDNRSQKKKFFQENSKPKGSQNSDKNFKKVKKKR